MRSIHVKVVPAAGLAALCLAVLYSGQLPAQAQPRLTCTVVQQQCFKRCESEAQNRQFCDQYCVDRQKECLSSGVWRGWFGDTFVNVVKQ